MDKYLAIMTTVLVITQVIRVTQNAIMTYRQGVSFKRDLDSLAECNPTKEDFEMQRKAYRLIVEHFEEKDGE